MEQAEALMQMDDDTFSHAATTAGRIYVELSGQGFSTRQMLGVAMRLLALITTRVNRE